MQKGTTLSIITTISGYILLYMATQVEKMYVNNNILATTSFEKTMLYNFCFCFHAEDKH